MSLEDNLPTRRTLRSIQRRDTRKRKIKRGSLLLGLVASILVILFLAISLLPKPQIVKSELNNFAAFTKVDLNPYHLLSFNDATQLGNAEIILNTVKERKLDPKAAVIAVTVAMTESSLRNLNYGDEAGPDSRGLFQQRDSWGTLAQRTDPASATGLFLDRLVEIPDYLNLPIAVVAQEVQVSALPDAYQKWEGEAAAIVALLSAGIAYK